MADPITFDLTRIQEWTKLRQRELPAAPYTALYEKDGYTLHYIAASHDFKNPLNNPTFAPISQLMQNDSPPKAVIVEVPPNYTAPTGQSVTLTEADFAIFLAKNKNVAIIGGEPTHEEVFSFFKEQGYSTQDAIGFYMSRMAAQLNEQRPPLDEAAFKEKAEKYLQSHSSFNHLSPDEHMDYGQFTAWYNEHNAGKELRSLTPDDLSPVAAPDASFLETMSFKLGKMREVHLNQKIEEVLHTYKDIGVIYGDSHFIKSQEVYEAALGKPEITTAIASSAKRETHEPDSPALGTRVTRQPGHHER